jgi:hypothetical protein
MQYTVKMVLMIIYFDFTISVFDYIFVKFNNVIWKSVVFMYFFNILYLELTLKHLKIIIVIFSVHKRFSELNPEAVRIDKNAKLSFDEVSELAELKVRIVCVCVCVCVCFLFLFF